MKPLRASADLRNRLVVAQFHVVQRSQVDSDTIDDVGGSLQNAVTPTADGKLTGVFREQANDL